jgi:pimeloyl-ACP methyl ester carboxylesterase
MSRLVRPTAVAGLPAGRVEYRLDGRGDAVIVVFHGGHVRAGLALGEDAFAAAGCTVLVPSRPGYGRTPLSSGPSVERYVDVVRQLCTHLGIARVAAVVGISGGGPTAATMAARHPDLVERLILLSAVSWLPYPGRWTRVGAHLAFSSGVERLTWAGIHALARMAPGACLRMMLRGLSTRPAGAVLATLRTEDRAMLLALFTQMRSGRGFVNDLRATPDVTSRIEQPTLVVATRADGGVPFAHARSLAGSIRHAELVESQADSHFVWLGADWPAIADRIVVFLGTDPCADRGSSDRSSHPAPPAATGESADRLARAFHRPLRIATAGLALVGALLAAGTAGPAFVRLGPSSGLTFLAVAAACVGWAVAVLRRARWARAASAALLGGQLAAIVGTTWELATGVAAGKAGWLHRLGVPPTAGLLVNLAYSAVAVMLFGWLARRWRTTARPRPGRPRCSSSPGSGCATESSVRTRAARSSTTDVPRRAERRRPVCYIHRR